MWHLFWQSDCQNEKKKKKTLKQIVHISGYYPYLLESMNSDSLLYLEPPLYLS